MAFRNWFWRERSAFFVGDDCIFGSGISNGYEVLRWAVVFGTGLKVKVLLMGIVLLGLAVMFPQALADPVFPYSGKLLNAAGIRHGQAVKERLYALKRLVMENRSLPDREKLEVVNNFWNRVSGRDGGIRRSLLTPFETLLLNAVDCKDYATGKYLTLVAMGVDIKKLRLAYVLHREGPHMVLKYQESPESVPLVLDNVAPGILPDDERPDIRMVFAFNDHGMWVFNRAGQTLRHVSKSPHFWRKMRARIGRELD